MILNQFKTRRELFFFLLLPKWKAPYEEYVKACNFTKRLQARKELDAHQNIYAFVTLFGWIAFGLLTGWLPYTLSGFFGETVGNQTQPATWYRIALSVIFTTLWVTVVVMTYRGLVNSWAIKRFVIPDTSRFVKSDEPLTVDMLPEPRPNEILLGASAKDVIWYKLDQEGYAGHIGIVGRQQNRERLPLSILWGASEPNLMVYAFDTKGGLDLAFLKHDYRNLLELEKFNLLPDEKLLELAVLPRLPNVIVKNDDGNGAIDTGLNWLSVEFHRRSRMRDLDGNATFPRILILLDEEIAKVFTKEKPSFQSDILISILTRGKVLNMNLLAIFPVGVNWQKGLDDYAQYFDLMQVHHTQIVHGGDEKGFAKNVVPALNHVFSMYIKGTQQVIKAVDVDGRTLAERYYTLFTKSSPQEKETWQAALYERQYREPGKPPIIVQDSNGLRKAA